MHSFTGVARVKVSEDVRQGAKGQLRIAQFIFDDKTNDTWLPLKAYNQTIDDINEGETYLVNFYIKSREYNGKYYSDIVIYSVVNVGKQAQQGAIIKRGDPVETVNPVIDDTMYSSSPKQTVPPEQTVYPETYVNATEMPQDDLPF